MGLRPRKARALPTLAKAPTGIDGLDLVMGGGIPAGRPSLVVGGPGSGKTLLGLQFLAHGARALGEGGVICSFEENAEELTTNAASLGINLQALCTAKKLAIDYVRVERSEVEEIGEYNLDALFVRLAAAVKSVGARRILLDSLGTLFAGLRNRAILRAELHRLFRWMKEQELTAIITAERGARYLTPQGIHEYVSDCVMLLENRLRENVMTRSLRVLKYRGSAHGTHRYPFQISGSGFKLLPVTELRLSYPAKNEFVSSGLPGLDEMLGGKGFHRGSAVLVSGMAGTGKTSLAAYFATASAQRGERCLYAAFEESPDQIARNMGSIGVDLKRWQAKDRLRYLAMRPIAGGLEAFLVKVSSVLDEFTPDCVVLDPISSFISAGNLTAVSRMLARLIDLLKLRGITTFMTSLLHGSTVAQETDTGVSSYVDTWLLLRDLEYRGERNRLLSILKARGIRHSNQVREFQLSPKGLALIDVRIGPYGILTGSERERHARAEARQVQELQQHEEARTAHLQERKRLMEARIALLRAEYDAEAAQVDLARRQENDQDRLRLLDSNEEGNRRTKAPWQNESY